MRITLEELKKRCKNAGFKYAYGGFDKEISPSHLVATMVENRNFNADGKTYVKKNTIKLDYTYEKKDIEEQNKIEDEILEGLTWRKGDETYLSNDKVWQVSYFFEI